MPRGDDFLLRGDDFPVRGEDFPQSAKNQRYVRFTERKHHRGEKGREEIVGVNLPSQLERTAHLW